MRCPLCGDLYLYHDGAFYCANGHSWVWGSIERDARAVSGEEPYDVVWALNSDGTMTPVRARDAAAEETWENEGGQAMSEPGEKDAVRWEAPPHALAARAEGERIFEDEPGSSRRARESDV